MTGGLTELDAAWLRDELLGCDPEWSADAPGGFDHWPYFLRQRITISPSPFPPPSPEDGDMLRHAATCEVVRGLTDLDRATAVCAALNRYTAGWSYVVEPSEARIVAHTSVDCPTQWQLPILRWIEAALISMWHAAVIAPALADAVGGEVDVSFPPGGATGGARTQPDDLMGYSDSLRARPEWVLGPADSRWGDLGATAAILAGALDDESSGESREARSFELPLETMTLTGRMQDQPGLGHGFEARAILTPPAGDDTEPEALANALNWLVLSGEAPGVAGAWTVAEQGELVFRAFTMDFALEHLLAAEVVDGAPEVLATITLEVAAGAAELPDGLLAEASAPTGAASAERDLTESELAAIGVLAAIWQPSISAVMAAMDGTVPAGSDPRLLLLPRPHPGSGVEPIVTWGVVDGRTHLTTLALVGTADDDARLLVSLRRDPIEPHYGIRAGIRPRSSPAPAIADAIEELLVEPPAFVDLAGCPAELVPTVCEALAEASGAASDDPEWLQRISDPAAIADGSARLSAIWDAVRFGGVA